MVINTSKDRMNDSETIRVALEELIKNFETELHSKDLRKKVLALVPIFNKMRSLGKSLLSPEYASAAIERILYYFQKYPFLVIKGDELLVVSGIQDYPRRVRELRVQFGWYIASGVTINAMREAGEKELPVVYDAMKPAEYVLLDTHQDREAAFRWKLANSIRKKKIAVRDKILQFLQANVGKPVTGEELRYVAKNKTEWARRGRELRTDFGWPLATRTTGRPDLPIGFYILQADRQSPIHDRNIPDDVRREVLRRDGYKCNKCGWSHAEWNPSDPRHLEIHHIEHYAKGGGNQPKNLRTLCVVCHDKLHRDK